MKEVDLHVKTSWRGCRPCCASRVVGVGILKGESLFLSESLCGPRMLGLSVSKGCQSSQPLSIAELAAKTVSWAPLLVPNHVVSYHLSTLWSLTLLLRVFSWPIPPCHSVEAKCKGIHTKLLALFPWCTGAVVQPLNIVTWCHQQSVWGRTVPMDYKVNLKNTHNVLSVWPLW